MTAVLEILGLFTIGLLAGDELVIRYGVQPALRGLEERAHLLARQALVRRLRVLVPALMVPTVLLGVVVLATSGTGPGLTFRWVGMAALVAFVLLTFLGTVPINIQVNDWQVDAPPSDWRAVIHRWEQIDVFRSSAAVVAFASYLIAVGQQLG